MKRFSKGIIGALLALSITTTGMAPGIAMADTKKATPQDARKAAYWQVMSEVHSEQAGGNWANKRVKFEKPIEVYDPAGNQVAYLVNVTADGKPSGYVMVSAFLDDQPVIEWADAGTSFTTDKMKNKLKDRASKIKSERVVWLGGINFAAKYDLNDGTSTMIDERGTENQNNNNNDNNANDKYPAPQTENKNNREDWTKMMSIPLGDVGTNSDGVTNEDPSGFETDYLSIHRNYIDTSVNQKQWYYNWVGNVGQATGCSPTAGSNIMKYWADKGYTSLNPTGYQSDIVFGLRTEMGTSQSSDGTGTTYSWNIDDGLQSYARKHGRPNAVATNDNFSNFSTVVTEVDAQRPALQSYWGQSYFGDHTVTVVGYKEYVRTWDKPNSYYVVVRNNWIGDNQLNLWVRWGTWNSNVVTTFQP